MILTMLSLAPARARLGYDDHRGPQTAGHQRADAGRRACASVLKAARRDLAFEEPAADERRERLQTAERFSLAPDAKATRAHVRSAGDVAAIGVDWVPKPI